MSFIWAALMPHPPVIVPEVGRGREKEAAITLNGVKRLVEALRAESAGEPECILLLSPHQPYASGAMYINSAPSSRGNLGRFGASHVSVEISHDSQCLDDLAGHLKKHGIPVIASPMADITPDHGSIVPLYYLSQCFKDGKLPPVILASPTGLAPEKAFDLGRALASHLSPKKWALLASGDLSHRLTPGAPAGYSPEGKVFDAAIVDALRSGRPDGLFSLSARTLEGAGECGLRSVLAMLGLSKAPAEIFSYEGPFGVGYCNALWMAGKPGQGENNGGGKTPGVNIGVNVCPQARPATPRVKSSPYPRLARKVVEELLAGRDVNKIDMAALDPDQNLWTPKKACFVSIRTRCGALRGCIGTIIPVQADLCREIITNAVSASTRDPRFPPMASGELPNVVFSVDVLSAPEPVKDISELDPAKWGVIVSKDGMRGLLLPDLEGVNTVAKQLAIAAQKGGISCMDGAKIERFSVTRYPEEE